MNTTLPSAPLAGSPSRQLDTPPAPPEDWMTKAAFYFLIGALGLAMLFAVLFPLFR